MSSGSSSKSKSKDRFEKTFSRKKKKESTTDKKKQQQQQQQQQTTTTTEQKSKHPSQTVTPSPSPSPSSSSNDKHTKITILGLQHRPPPQQQPTNSKKKKRNLSNGSINPDQLKKMKTKSGKDEEEAGLECAFPTARITRIVKSEGFDSKITGEAVFLINKATEKFIGLFCEDAYSCAAEDRKSFVGYKHLSSVVSKGKLFDFLSDFVPEKVTVEKAFAEQNPAETLAG